MTHPRSEALSPWVMQRAASIEFEPLQAPFTATLALPGSKSYTNRALILAALASGVSVLKSPLFSDDSYWCVESLRRLGVLIDVERERDEISITGIGQSGGALRQVDQDEPLYLGSAGTAARFLPAVIAARGAGEITLTASSQLARRPVSELIVALRELGAEIETPTQGGFPMRIRGGSLRGGVVTMSGRRSSQFISALLLAAPLASEPVTLHITDGIVQADYVRITLDMMALWGVKVEHDEALTTLHISPQPYLARTEVIEADASTATCLLALAASTQSALTITNLNPNTRQPDLQLLDHLSAMGCEVIWEERSHGSHLTLRGPERLQGGVEFDFKPCSDSTPALAIAAAFASGPVGVSGVAHIRDHECDRISVICDHLTRAQVDVVEREDGLLVRPSSNPPAWLHAHPQDDHRMAMAFSALALAGRGGQVDDPACVSKTCPTFYEMLKTLGARYQIRALS